MPNVRAIGQKLINVPMSPNFRALLDRAVDLSGYEDRSKFIRDAIVEKMEREGYEVPPLADRKSPSRLGAGGPRKKPAANSADTTIHSSALPGANSEPVSDAAKKTKKGAMRAAGVTPKPSP